MRNLMKICSILILALFSTLSLAQQYGRPVSTVSAGSWTASGAATLHEAVDEITPNDATDYITAGSLTTATFALGSLTDPLVSTGHIIRFRMMTLGGQGPERCTLRLYQGTTLIAQLADQSSRNSYATFEYTLLAAEADAITDYTALRLEVSVTTIANNGEEARVTWMELQIPDAATANPPTLSTPTVTSVEIAQASLGATIDSDGGAAITERGTVWGTTTGPTGNVQAEGGTALGAFSHTRIALPGGSQIFFRGYADNSEGRAYSPELSFWTEPTKAASVTFSGVTENTMTINWSAGGGTGALVLVKEAGAVSASPVDGTIYTASTIFGIGSQIGAGNYVVFASTGTSVTVTGLTADTTYHVAVFEFAGSGTGISGINYQQDVPAIGSQATDAGTAVPTLSSPTVSAIDLTTATLGATLDTDGGDTILERGTVWGTSASPTGNVLAEGGTALGAFTHGRTGLPSGTQIFFRGYADNNSGRGYSPDGSFYSEPTQASLVTFSSVQSTSLTVNWTAGGGDGAIVIMRETDPVSGSPTDGTEHAASQTFGSGALIGTDNYVVYRGPANSVTVNGLTAETAYHVAVFEYAGSGTGISGINYQQDSPAVGNDTTGAPAEGHNANYGIQCDQCHALHSPFGGTGVVARGTDQLTVCTQCHNATGSASAKIDIGLHEVDGGSTIIDCGSCHEIHNGYDFNTTDTHSGGVTAPNISRIRSDVSKYVPAAIEPAIFQQRPAHFAFGETASGAPYNGICQACHTSTSMHTNTLTTANNDHEVGGECMDCHAHDGGFAVSGGGCSSCHSTPKDAEDGAPTRRAIFGEFGLTSHHVEAGTANDDDCGVCHGEVYGTPTHANNQVDLKNPDTGALISFTTFTRNRSTDTLESWVTDVQNNFCLKCHDSDGATATNFSGNALRPFTVGTRDVPDVFTSADPANATHHAIRAAGSNPYTVPSTSNGSNITMVTPWNQDATHDMISCFDCHATSGHGNANQRMLRDPIDFDTMASTADPANLPSGMGATVETFCTRCHKSTVYVSSTDSEGAGSIFEFHGQSQQQHSAAGGNELGCMGCHAGVINYSKISTNNGAAWGNIHGRNFIWPADTPSDGTATEYFMMGGWMGGWIISGSIGECNGGECNHAGSSTRFAQDYTR